MLFLSVDGEMSGTTEQHRTLLNRTEMIQWFSGVGLALLVGVLIMGIWSLVVIAPTARTLSTACDDENACTADFEVGPTPKHCERFPLSTASSCTSACHADGTTTHCDGAGACVADDWTACKGYCEWDVGGMYDGDCNNTALFPLLPYFINPYFIEDNGTINDACIANQCVRVILQAMMETDVGSDGSEALVGGSGFECHDLLDADAGVDLSCIKATEILVDASFVSDLIALHVDTGLEYTARYCVFQYSCAAFNTSAFSDEDNLVASVAQQLKRNTHPATEALHALSQQALFGAVAPSLKSNARSMLARNNLLPSKMFKRTTISQSD